MGILGFVGLENTFENIPPRSTSERALDSAAFVDKDRLHRAGGESAEKCNVVVLKCKAGSVTFVGCRRTFRVILRSFVRSVVTQPVTK